MITRAPLLGVLSLVLACSVSVALASVVVLHVQNEQLVQQMTSTLS